MRQEPDESLDTFITRCRTLVLQCDFTEDELEARIIEQIIVSTLLESFQGVLISKTKDLKLEDAAILGRKYEAAKVKCCKNQKHKQHLSHSRCYLCTEEETHQ